LEDQECVGGAIIEAEFQQGTYISSAIRENTKGAYSSSLIVISVYISEAMDASDLQMRLVSWKQSGQNL
jgi:hypothetical protein